MQRSTFTNYTAWWKQLLSYVVRCEELEDDERAPFSTPRSRTSLGGLMDAVDQLMDYEEQGRDSEDEAYDEARASVQKALLQLCIAL
jgi:hypothetical protein